MTSDSSDAHPCKMRVEILSEPCALLTSTFDRARWCIDKRGKLVVSEIVGGRYGGG